MKKSLFFVAAASALMLTACSSENDVVQSATPTQTTVEQKAVGFDIYTPAATNVTRAGLEGTMTTSRMQRSEYEGGGFGVYAFLIQDKEDDETATTYADWLAGFAENEAKIPNFMVNEKILWNATNQGWYYNPLKYWPNETDNDSQNTKAEMEGIGGNKHLDRLTFFAYAPYVAKGGKASTTPGITYLTNSDGKLYDGGIFSNKYLFEPSIGYRASLDDPNKAVDLLWGVAPSGGLEYTAVNGQTVKVNEGLPLIDMTKPNVNTNMKFLFQHALARIGVTAVAAIDQVGAGGTLDPNTKITIEKITLTGYFGETGILNLNNTKSGVSVANWMYANGKRIKDTSFGNLKKSTITLQANHTTPEDGTIATHLQWKDNGIGGPDPQTDRVGVTTVRQNVIQPADIDNTPGANRNWYTSKEYGEKELAYSETTPYYTGPNCDEQAKVTMPVSYTINSQGVYTECDANPNFTYPMVLQNYLKATGWHPVDEADVAAGKYDNFQAYEQQNIPHYTEKAGPPAPGDYVNVAGTWTEVTTTNAGDYATGYTAYTQTINTIKVPIDGKPVAGNYVIEEGILFYKLDDDNKAAYAGLQQYTKTEAAGGKPEFYTPVAEGTVVTAGNYVALGVKKLYVPYYAGNKTYYKRDANYFMVVPTNNFVNENSDLSANEVDLRTVRVMIEYYITTEDGKLAA